MMTQKSKSEVVLYLVLFLLALLVRSTAVAAMGLSDEPTSDEIEYFQPALSFANGQGICKIGQQSLDGVARPTAYRMPLPSIIMGLGLALFGPHHAVARLITIVIGSLAAPLMYRFAGRFAPRPAAVLASVGVIFHPVLVFYTTAILSEPYFITATLLALDLTAGAAESRSAPGGLLAGLAWGLAILVKPHAAPAAFLIMVYLFARGSWKSAAGLSLGVILLVMPWAVRNLIVVGHPVLLATEGGETFLGSNNPYVLDDPKLWGQWISPLKVEKYRDRLGPIQDEIKRSEEQYAIATTFLAQNPKVIPVLVIKKLVRWLTPITESRGAIRIVVLGTYGSLLLLLAIGAFRGVYRSTVPLFLVAICSVVMTIITVVYWGNLTRGRMPLEILWIPWASLSVWDLVGPTFTHRWLNTR